MQFYWVEQGVVLRNKIKVQGERLICVNQALKVQKSDHKMEAKTIGKCTMSRT